MLARDVRLEDFGTTDWRRLADLVSNDGPRVVDGRAGGVIAVVTGERLRKLVSTRRGRLDPEEEPWPEPLEKVCERHDARWAARVHTGALEELMDRFGARLEREHDLLEQSLLLIEIARDLVAEQAIEVWPWKPESWPVPSAAVVRGALDVLCPNGKVIAICAFDRGAVYTCVALRRMGSGFDRIVGPERVRREMGLVSSDWTRDYRHLARAIEERVGPLAVGCFAELPTYRRLARAPAPGGWASAVASRDIMLAPVTAAVALPLAIDVGRAALAGIRSMAGRIGRAERAKAVLGFDPMAILSSLMSRRD